MITQEQRELQQRQQAADRALDGMKKLVDAGHGNLRDSAQTLIKAGIPKLGAAIRKWQEEQLMRKHGHRGSTRSPHLLKGAPPELLAYLALSELFARSSRAKSHKFATMANRLGVAVELELKYAKMRTDYPHIWKMLEKQGRLDGQAMKIRGTTLRKAAEFQKLEWKEWTKVQRIHVGATLYGILENTMGLVELTRVDERAHPAGRIKTPLVYKLTDKTLDWLDQRDLALAFRSAGLYPMIEMPADWVTPEDGGYATVQMSFTKTRNMEWLEQQHHRDLNFIYDAMNAVQRTAWAVDEDILEILETAWTAGWPMKGVPDLDDLPLPTQPEGSEKGSPAYSKWRVQLAQAKRWNYKQASRRASTASTIACARSLKNDPCVFFPQELDWRGRMYSTAVGISPQGADYQKGLLKFAEAKPLTDDSQWAWLKRQGANTWGHDKLPFKEREAWVDREEDLIRKIADDPLSHREWMEADAPFGFLAFCVDYRQALDTGSSSLPVAMDGSCSGLQHYSAMLRDAQGAAATNLIPSASPADIYSEVAGLLSEALEAKVDDEMATLWLESGLVNRTLCKRPTMTTPYGVTHHGILEQTAELLHGIRLDTGEKPIEDGTDTMARAVTYITPMIREGIHRVVPLAMEAMAAIRYTADQLAVKGAQASWLVPFTNFQVQQDYVRFKSRRVKTILHGRSYKFSLIEDDPGRKPNRMKAKAGSAPNLVHSLDAAHLMMTVNAMCDQADTPASFAMIHDSFGCHAADAPLMAKVLREQFVRLYEDEGMLSQLVGSMLQVLPAEDRPLVELPQSGQFDLQQVHNAEYFFA